MAWAALFRPKTKNWRKAGAAIGEYLHEQEAIQRKALRLEEKS
jgi:hypothetical protein